MRRGPHRYARILDASYGALKRVSRKNLVIGGNTFTTGDISVLNWIKNLKLPNGKPPRMDMYGHNPFNNRPPVLHGPAAGPRVHRLHRPADPRALDRPLPRAARATSRA